jgi:2-dehydro-3-deoxy-D-arabinonate dehydratase
MLLYRTRTGWVVDLGEGKYVRPSVQTGLTVREDLFDYLKAGDGESVSSPTDLLAPIDSQEVWAAGVTYFRSRTARMAESKETGGGDFYDRVYLAERPEVFFKANPHRVVGTGAAVRIRSDSQWNIPEPELTLLISPQGQITGYTVGNDMSSRDIEGENPLYLPQAKVYDQCCALGPAVWVNQETPKAETEIGLRIFREGAVAFEDTTTLAAMKRKPEELVQYLYREASFPNGAFLMTGTGIVPPDSFTLASGDRVDISISGIGTLSNPVERRRGLNT